MGATVIVTGLSSEIAQTLVTIGVDLTRMKTVGDLQGGIEEAERLLGYEILRPNSLKAGEPAPKDTLDGLSSLRRFSRRLGPHLALCNGMTQLMAQPLTE